MNHQRLKLLLIGLLLILSSCTEKFCPAYQQVGNQKPLISYRR